MNLSYGAVSVVLAVKGPHQLFLEAGEVASRRRACPCGIISQITTARQIP